jgi:hypothetical protein
VSTTSAFGFEDLPGGPSVTVEVPASGRVLVTVSAFIFAPETVGYMSFASSGPGANVFADPDRALGLGETTGAGLAQAASYTALVTVGPGTKTFTAKYATTFPSQPATFSSRSIIAIPLA